MDINRFYLLPYKTLTTRLQSSRLRHLTGFFNVCQWKGIPQDTKGLKVYVQTMTVIVDILCVFCEVANAVIVKDDFNWTFKKSI